MSDPVLINVLVFLVAAFGLLVVGMVFMFLRVYSRLQKLQSQITNDRAAILKKAQDAADSIVSQAQMNAQSIIGSAHDFNAKAEATFEQELKSATGVYAEKYNQLLQTMSQKMEGLYSEMSDSLTSVASSSTKEFDTRVEKSLQGLSEQINKEVGNLQEQLAKIAEDEKKTLQIEYETIRAQKVQQLEDKLVSVVSMIAREAISVSIPESENEKLILKALSDAKEKGVFK